MGGNPAAFEEVEHTADLSLRVRGADLRELFVHAAQGMCHLMQCQRTPQSAPICREVVLAASDLETLLVDWLGELLYLSETNRCCFDRYDISRLEATQIRAQVHGLNHCPAARGIKAVTYSGLEVARNAQGMWECVITFDV